MKKIINNKYFSWFRKGYLKFIYRKIVSYEEDFCCLAAIDSVYSSFICWKELKEVKENMTSKYLIKFDNYNCDHLWFYKREDRLNFLKECLNKFK